MSKCLKNKNTERYLEEYSTSDALAFYLISKSSPKILREIYFEILSKNSRRILFREKFKIPLKKSYTDVSR